MANDENANGGVNSLVSPTPAPLSALKRRCAHANTASARNYSVDLLALVKLGQCLHTRFAADDELEALVGGTPKRAGAHG